MSPATLRTAPSRSAWRHRTRIMRGRRSRRPPYAVNARRTDGTQPSSGRSAAPRGGSTRPLDRSRSHRRRAPLRAPPRGARPTPRTVRPRGSRRQEVPVPDPDTLVALALALAAASITLTAPPEVLAAWGEALARRDGDR